MKKIKKLALKKVTLRDLDESTLNGVAGATAAQTNCKYTCETSCPGPYTCGGAKSCIVTNCACH